MSSVLVSTPVAQAVVEHAEHDAPDDAAEHAGSPGGEVAKIEQAQSSGSQSPTAEFLVGIKPRVITRWAQSHQL